MKSGPPPQCPAILCLALALAAGLAAPARVGAQHAGGQQAAQAGEALGVDLFHTLGAGDGNIVFSPYSISEVLALLSSGADGGTKKELLQALHWGQAPDRLPAAFGAQDLHLDRAVQGGAILHVANGLWYQQGNAPRPEFLALAQGYYRAEVRAADFIGNAPAVRSEINSWVEERTGGKIPSMLPEGTPGRSTRLAIANAVFFKGTWQHPFKHSRTAYGPFTTAPGSAVSVPLMAQTERFRFVSEPGCDILELPYDDGQLSMVILLPREPDGLAALEQGLDPASLLRWLASLDFSRTQNTRVTLPRFRMSYGANLIPALRQSGVSAAFDPNQADFSAIDGARDLYVNVMLHRAFIEVNEEGTEAAAATFAGVATLGVEMSREFKVDHPFLFLIRDGSTGSLLFLGRVADPRER